MFLSPEQIEILTGKQRHRAQVRALVAMGIPHHLRPDGRPIVLATDLEHHEEKAPRAPQAPDFSSLEA